MIRLEGSQRSILGKEKARGREMVTSKSNFDTQLYRTLGSLFATPETEPPEFGAPNL